MKEYIKPEFEIRKAQPVDIILASDERADIEGGIIEFIQEWLNS